MDPEFELEWQLSKDKDLTRLFWNQFNVSDLSTQFFSPAYNMVRVIEGKTGIEMRWSGSKNYFDLAGSSSYRGFELLRVKLQ